MNKKLSTPIFVVLLVLAGVLAIGWRVQAAPTGQESTPVEEAPRPRLAYGRTDELPWIDTGQPATESPNLLSPFIIPLDSSKIVFQSYRDLNSWDIYISDVGGSNLRRLTHETAAEIHPRLNRGCTRIAFASKQTGNYEIFTMNPDGAELVQLTEDESDDINPTWSVDGSRIAFQSQPYGQGEIYVMNADGSGQTRLTWDGDYDGMPSWSPDGSKIAFISRRTGGYRVYVMNPDGSGLVQLSNQPYSENPTWSPDGSQIAYDADNDGDGWQELWVMNADGSDQHMLYDPTGQTDAWARGWAPDGSSIAFTSINFVYYQGNWYWETARLYAYSFQYAGHYSIGSGTLDWNPDWQSFDALPPSTNWQVLPAISPSPIELSWLSIDNGQSGIQRYDIQYRDHAGGVWTDGLTSGQIASASILATGGHTYSFRVRATDWAWNTESWFSAGEVFTTVEDYPPRSAVFHLPEFVRNGSFIEWGGIDYGGSGIGSYDVQYRSENSGGWVDWIIGQPYSGQVFNGITGQKYSFRSRATDLASNSEDWFSDSEDTSTTHYAWGIYGQAEDIAGVPITDLSLLTSSQNTALQTPDGSGNYGLYSFNPASEFTATWRKDGYGALPVTSYMGEKDARISVVLPSEDDQVINGGFEYGTLSWVQFGDYIPNITNDMKHSGGSAIMLGESVPGWGAILPVVDSGNPNHPQLAIGPHGELHTVWNSTSSGNFILMYASKPLGDDWTNPISIPAGIGSVSNKQIVIGSNGEPHILVSDYDNQIAHIERLPAGEWSNPYIVPRQTSGPMAGGDIAIGEDGTIHIIWAEEIWFEYQFALYYIQRDQYGSWSSPILITNNSSGGIGKSLFVDTNGNLHARWLERTETDEWPHLYYSKLSVGGTWSIPQDVSLAPAYSLSSLAVDEQGNVHVAWYSNENPHSLYYRFRNDTGRWSAPLKISDLGYWDHSQALYPPIILFSHGGEVNLFWYQDLATEPASLYFARLNQYGIWSIPENVSLATGHPTRGEANVVLDNFGQLHAAWIGGGSEFDTYDVYYSLLGIEGDWTSPQNLSNNTGESYCPLLAVDGWARAHLVWMEFLSSGGVLQYRGPNSVVSGGISMLYQSIQIPFTQIHPTLSFLYQLNGASQAGGTGLSVSISDSITTTEIFSTSTNTSDWTHAWSDLSPWISQTITLNFNVHEEAGYPYAWAYLDEVTVGSAHPDIWVSAAGEPPAALPGETVVYEISYGNRGAVDAVSGTLTATLPAGLTFVSASQPVTPTGSTLVWEVGELAAASQGETIYITATVNGAAISGSELAVSAEISSQTSELETANNTAQAAIYVGKRIYLPLLQR